MSSFIGLPINFIETDKHFGYTVQPYQAFILRINFQSFHLNYIITLHTSFKLRGKIYTFCQILPFATCAQQLHSGGIAQCNTRPSHEKALEVVDDGIIIINEETATVNMGNEADKTIHGTFCQIAKI